MKPEEIIAKIMATDYTDPANKLTRGKAIRTKCLDCMCGHMAQVRRCNLLHCPLWPYRMGTGTPPEWVAEGDQNSPRASYEPLRKFEGHS
jgi:hypothetical protein